MEFNSCAISEITVAELYYGLECAADGKSQKDIVESFCESMIVLPISGCIKTYAKQKAILRSKGLMIDDMDLLIGSTALYYNLVLVSDNTKHMERISLKLENWITR